MLTRLACHALAMGRIPALFQRFVCRDRVSILMYHAVVDQPLAVSDWCFLHRQEFLRQMLYLKRNFDVIPLGAVADGRPRTRPAAVVTFDDGFRNNYTVAYPILRELGLPATIFLVTDLVGSDDTVWFCRINDALAHTGKSRLVVGEHEFDLRTREERRRAGAQIQDWLKRFPHPEMLARMKEVVERLGQDPGKPIPPDSPFRMLDQGEIEAMRGSGLIDFGAHTASHAVLSLLSPAGRGGEIRSSLQAVERLTGRPCRQFCYPNGRACDFGSFDQEVLAGAGVQLAVSTIPGPSGPGDSLNLTRYGIGDDLSHAGFQMQVHHLEHYLRRMIA